MKLSIIAAIGREYELGKDNSLLWHLPGDLKFFKETTMGKTIVMGRNTFESLPKRLPGRKYIVLTSKNRDLGEDIKICHSVDELVASISSLDDEIFIIGGAKVYHDTIDRCDSLYLTEIDATAEADAYFPRFDKSLYDSEFLGENEDRGIKYKHMVYRRK